MIGIMPGIYWLASYPKSGNTWFRAFLSNLLRDGDRPAAIDALSTGLIASSRVWLDDALGFDTADLTDEELALARPAVYDWSARQGNVGYHKIHDAFTSVGGIPLVGASATLGALYIVRNPLDVAPSAAAHWGLSLDESIERMADPRAALSRSRRSLATQVRQCLGDWSGHVLSWVDAPGIRMQVIRYEDMQSAPAPTFTSAATFLGLPFDSARIGKAIRFSCFEVLSQQESESGFRERPAGADRFFRSGRSGGWRACLEPRQVRRIIEDHAAVMRRFGYLDENDEPV